MYIQTQANDKLINIDNVAVIEIVNGEGLKDACIVAADTLEHAEHRVNIILGKYESRERATQVMDDIISAIIHPITSSGNQHNDSYGDTTYYNDIHFFNIYEMPKV